MASNVFGEGEPARKKAKRQPDDIFKTLDNQVKLRLEKSLPIICNLPNLMFLKIIFANAKSRVPFSKATCDTEEMFWPDGNEPVNCTIDNLFVEGMDILNTYLNKNKIPEGQAYQDALAKLLKFFSEDQSPLFENVPENSEGEWTIRLAQHLLSKLSVHKSYVICAYKGSKFGSTCPCPKHDDLVGFSGDTSFGYKHGWHGHADIIIEQIPVSIEETPPLVKPKPDAYNAVNSTEMKATPSFSQEIEAQVRAQTITFSPLQLRNHKTELRNYLIPGIGIGTRDVLVYFYDSENDIFLRSYDMTLFSGGKITYYVVIFLWLTLNYRLFCSGLTEEMKTFKSGFFDLIDIDEFINNVQRPLHIKPSEDTFIATLNPDTRFKPAPGPVPEIKYIDI